MTIATSPDLSHFFSTYFSEADAEQDSKTVESFLVASSAVAQARVSEQAQKLVQSETLVEDLGMTANRWFSSNEEAQDWLQSIILKLSQTAGVNEVVVKDSNGAILAEGDSVTVIKDLKVKGGSSDLKRGTLIKKVHLIGDPGNIECNVDGSTLVLKTQFLKKA